MYTNPQPLRPPRVHSAEAGHLQGDEKAPDESDEDMDDAPERPTWKCNEIHLISMAAPPWWTLARCASFCDLVIVFVVCYCLCPHVSVCLKTCFR